MCNLLLATHPVIMLLLQMKCAKTEFGRLYRLKSVVIIFDANITDHGSCLILQPNRTVRETQIRISHVG